MKKISIALLAGMLAFSVNSYAQDSTKSPPRDQARPDTTYKNIPKKKRAARDLPMTKPEVDRTMKEEDNKQKAKADTIYKKPVRKH